MGGVRRWEACAGEACAARTGERRVLEPLALQGLDPIRHPLRRLHLTEHAEAGCDLPLNRQPPEKAQARGTIILDSDRHNSAAVAVDVQCLLSVLGECVQLRSKCRRNRR